MNEPSTLVSVRLPSELVQKLDSEAATRSRPEAKITRTDVIVEAVRSHLGTPLSVADSPLLTDLAGQKPYRCPATGCNLRFGSKAALCPTHGRRAVPV